MGWWVPTMSMLMGGSFVRSLSPSATQLNSMHPFALLHILLYFYTISSSYYLVRLCLPPSSYYPYVILMMLPVHHVHLLCCIFSNTSHEFDPCLFNCHAHCTGGIRVIVHSTHKTIKSAHFASYTSGKILNLSQEIRGRIGHQAGSRISRSCPILFDAASRLISDWSFSINFFVFCRSFSLSSRSRVVGATTLNCNEWHRVSFYPRCPSRNANLRPLSLFPSIGIVAAALLPLELWRH